jgi:hypothetical protein
MRVEPETEDAAIWVVTPSAGVGTTKTAARKTGSTRTRPPDATSRKKKSARFGPEIVPLIYGFILTLSSNCQAKKAKSLPAVENLRSEASSIDASFTHNLTF